jgi:lipopolysaccharide export LptBFGC system permease protein LptF
MRSPWTLWRHILIEFWRLCLLTSAILVTVLAFTAAVKFLADGRLGPLDTLRFMLYAVPPMLQYALPFAGGFAATLAYHRMAADNELVACHAGGMSHRRVLVPAVLSGLVLAAALAVVSDTLIPRYLRSMDDMIRQDVARVMVASINRGEPIQMDRSLIYADSVTPLSKPESGASDLLYLTGVLVVQLDKRGDVEAEGSAPEAYVWFYRDTALSVEESLGADDPDAESRPGPATGSVTRVIMDPRSFVGRKRGEFVAEQGAGRIERLVVSPFRDDPKFFGFADLNRLRATPERIGQVDAERRRLAAALGERAATGAIASALASGGKVEFTEGAGEATYVLQASRLVEYKPELRYWTLDPIASGPEKGRFILERRTPSGRPQVFRAERVLLRTDVNPDRRTGVVAVTLRLEVVSAVARTGRDDDLSARTKEDDIPGLVVSPDPVKPLLGLGAIDMLARADEHLARGADEYVQKPRDALSRRVQDLMNEITSKQHERIAVCVACLVMVLTGAVMAMRLRDALPLTVYLWSFFPALAAVITISAGQQLTHDSGPPGLLLLWGGVIAQAGYTFVQYRELARR